MTPLKLFLEFTVLFMVEVEDDMIFGAEIIDEDYPVELAFEMTDAF